MLRSFPGILANDSVAGPAIALLAAPYLLFKPDAQAEFDRLLSLNKTKVHSHLWERTFAVLGTK